MSSKRRKFSPEFKTKIVLSILSGRQSQAEICRQHKLKPDLVGRWKRMFLDNASTVFAHPQPQAAERQKVDELEQMIGRLTVQLEAAKKVSNIWD